MRPQWPGELGFRGGATGVLTVTPSATDTLEEGTPVVMEKRNAFLVYKVRYKEIVLPSQVDVVYPVHMSRWGRNLPSVCTMTTCSTETGGQFGIAQVHCES